MPFFVCLESMPYIYNKHWNVLCLTFQSFFFRLLYSAQEIQHAPIAERINTQSSSSSTLVNHSVSITFYWLESVFVFFLPFVRNANSGSHSNRFANEIEIDDCRESCWKDEKASRNDDARARARTVGKRERRISCACQSMCDGQMNING